MKEQKLEWIPIDEIKERDDLPAHGGRKSDDEPGDASLERLMKSIDEVGLINTVAVDEQHRILAGRRRLKALKRMGTEKVPCLVFEGLSRIQALQLMVDENVRRLNLSEPELALMADAFHERKREEHQTAISTSNIVLEIPTSVDTKRDSKPGPAQGQVWTLEDTAKVFGVTPMTVSRWHKIAKTIKENPKFKDERHGTRILRAAIRNEALDRYKKSGFERPPPYLKSNNFWYFADRDVRYGTPDFSHGVVPGQVIENLLWVYTEKGELVVDPMAGGGTVPDVCKAWERPCLAYDIDPKTPDIKKNDIREGLPPECKGASLVYLDPPYYNMVEKFYEDLDEYLHFQGRIIRVAAENVKVGGYVAYIIMDYWDMTDGCRYGEGISLIGEAYAALSQEFCLTFQDCIAVPIPAEYTRTGYQHTVKYEQIKTEKRLSSLNRVIWVFRKAEEIPDGDTGDVLPCI